MFNTAEKIRAKEISDAKNNFPGIQNLGEKEILKEIPDSKKIVVANNYDNIPEELKSLKQWVCYKLIWSDKKNKFDKIPKNPFNGFNAKSNDPKTWSSFETAKNSIKRLKFDGVGIEFKNNIFGVDIDNCISDSGLNQEAKEIIETLDSYTEFSPSGKGFHILCRGAIPAGGRRKDNVEMYSSGRFFTVTGNIFEGRNKLNERTREAKIIHRKYICLSGDEFNLGFSKSSKSKEFKESEGKSIEFKENFSGKETGKNESKKSEGKSEEINKTESEKFIEELFLGKKTSDSENKFVKSTEPKPIEIKAKEIQDKEIKDSEISKNVKPNVKQNENQFRKINDLDENKILEKAFASKNGYSFYRLWNGDTSGFPSHSEADLSLCRMLAFWTKKDSLAIDRMFRKSSLFRAKKWDEIHGKDTYGQMTIEKAISATSNVYSKGEYSKSEYLYEKKKQETKPNQEIKPNVEKKKQETKSNLEKNSNENSYENQNEKSEEISEEILEENLNENSDENSEDLNSKFEKMFHGTGFTIEDGCMCRLVSSRDDQNKFIAKKLCNFVAWYEKQQIVHDGIESKFVFTMKGILSGGKHLPTIEITASELQSMNWIIKKWGGNCTIATGNLIKDCIRLCIQEISNKNAGDEEVFAFTGWKKLEGNWVYLHQGGAIGAKNIIVRLNQRLEKYVIEKKSKTIETKEIGIPKIFELTKIANDKIILPLIAFAFLTPLNEFLRKAGYEPKFVYFLCGKTGTGKSSLAALFLSFFGNFTNCDLPMSFMDTSTSIISKTFLLKDILTCIDDYKPSTRADVAKMDNTAQIILRSFGDRTGRGRCDSNASEKRLMYPRCNAIITGEMPPNVGESGIARFIVSEIKEKDANFKEMSYAQKDASNGVYLEVMYDFINWIRNKFLNKNSDSEKLNENEKQDESQNNGEKKLSLILGNLFEKRRENLTDKLHELNIPYHTRVPEMIAHLSLGYSMFLDFCEDKTKEDSKKIRKEEKFAEFKNIREFESVGEKKFESILIEMARDHSEFLHNEKPSEKFIGVVRSLIFSNSVNTHKLSSEGGPLPGTFCYEDDKFYYFDKNKLYNEVVSFLRKQDEAFPINQPLIWKHLYEAGFILPMQGRQWGKVKSVCGKLLRLIYFYKDKLAY
jgi:primase-polymerase (primpol)-like protein